MGKRLAISDVTNSRERAITRRLGGDADSEFVPYQLSDSGVRALVEYPAAEGTSNPSKTASSR